MSHTLQSLIFRNWQLANIPGYVERFNNAAPEVTIAHQGSGKTIYAAACYIASLNLLGKADLTIENLRSTFEKTFIEPCRYTDFVFVVVPRIVNKSSTIRDWGKLGVTIAEINNFTMSFYSAQELIDKKIQGLILTYSQIQNNGYNFGNVWIDNFLVKFMSKNPDTNYHVILDEAHKMTIRRRILSKEKIVEYPNLAAKFFLDHSSKFKKMHLLSGTLIKSKNNRTPFVEYSEETNFIKPNTLFTKQDAVNEGSIVPTKIAIHKIETSEIIINGKLTFFKDSDFDYYEENYKFKVVTPQNKIEKEEQTNILDRLKEIETHMGVLSKNEGLWGQLICYGDKWLLEAQKKFDPKIKGIIFCPGVESAIMVHKLIGQDRSLLCVAKTQNYNFTDTLLVSPRKIGDFLESNLSTNIDWLVTCEALNEGFDYPYLKVSILLPRLEFLSLTKISQSLGRINRVIPGLSGLNAVCLTLNYKPVRDLVYQDEINMYGLIAPDNYSYATVEQENYKIKQTAKRKTDLQIKKEDFKANNKVSLIVEIKNLKLSRTIETLFLTKFDQEDYDSETARKSEEIRIRNFYASWDDLINDNSEYDEFYMAKNFPPDNVSGCYIVINAKTQETLYIGDAHNLRKRICDRKRYRSLKWIAHEGYNNLFVVWEECQNYKDRQDELKDVLKPKYDEELRRSKAYKNAQNS